MSADSRFLPRTPMLWAVVFMAAGIVYARYLLLPMWVSAACAVVMIVTGASVRRRPVVSTVCVALALFCAGAFMMESRRPVRMLVPGGDVVLSLYLTEPASVSGRWQRAQGEVVASYGVDSMQIAGERVVAYVDTACTVTPFRTLLCRAYVAPIDTAGSGYGRLMAARGYFNRLYISHDDILGMDERPRTTLRRYALAAQAAATERLSRLGLTGDEAALARAMVAGDRRGFDRELRGDYASSGAAHLLAVSGLHVGMVFLLVNIVLLPVVLLPRGHIWKNLLAAAAIFAYAFMAGMSPSVLRAAVMFAFVQWSLASGRSRNTLNTLSASAFVLLVCEPGLLFDVSFQMSYAAVFSIVMFGVPLLAALRTGRLPIDLIVGSLAVGLAASVGTAPLTAYYFGSFPLAGVLLNPLVILSAHVVVLFGVAWVVAPVEWLRGLFSFVVGGAARLQNLAVERFAGAGWGWQRVELPLWGVFLCYAVLAGGYCLWVKTWRRDTGR